MANVFYPKWKEFLLQSLLSADLKIVLVDTNDYTFSNAHQFLSDIPAAARVATSPNLSNKAVTNGVLTADNFVFPTVTGDESEAVVLYIDSGDPTTSRIIAFYDSAIGLSLVPNGENINLFFPSGQVFTL